MKSIRLRWVLPNTRDDGSNLPVEEIKHVEIFTSVDPNSMGWQLVDSFASDVTEQLIEDLDAGSWHFRGIVVGTFGKQSLPKDIVVEIPRGNPSPLVDFTGTVE